MTTKLLTNSFCKRLLQQLLLVALLCGPTWALAEPLATITGKMLNSDGKGLEGGSVVVKGTTRGVITDAKGAFSIEAEPSDVLVFTFYGFRTQEITVGNQSNVTVSMEPDYAKLDEVVVVAYGTQKKSHLTGSISSVKNETLDQIPVSRADDALVGQVAGVNIQMTNPAAGEAPTIRVRGQGSISFDSNPLIVIDGIAVGNDASFLSSIDMNDIESIEVLKDAASSSLYGSRGANGIIMITTKKGVEGPTKFTYHGFTGIKSVPEGNYLSTVDEWADFVRANNDGQLTDKMRYIEQLVQAVGSETDWSDVMFDGGMIQSHALSARGGTKNTKFRASLSYLDDQGVLLTDNFEKINFRLNLDTRLSKRVRFGVMINPSHTNQRRFPIGIHDAQRQNPWLPLYLDENSIQFVNRSRENGRWADAQIGDYAMERMFDDFDLEAGVPSSGSGTDISATSNQSALAKVLERDRRRFQTKLYANTYLSIDIVDGLNFKQTLGGDVRFTRDTRWAGIEASRNGAGDSESILTTNNLFHTISESTLNFDKEYGNHDINVVAGFAYERWDRNRSEIEAAGFTNDFIQTIPAANLVGGTSSATEEALISYLTRFNYAYAGKYLFSLSARWDGSSKFGPDNKYGFFPAVSAGWRVSEENFMKQVKFINDLKVRASYGITGSNTGIDEYDYIGLIEPVGTALGGANTGFNAVNISNSALRWEKLIEYNVGLDFSIVSGRFGFSVDYYNRTSEDLLLNLPIPSITGFETALVNRGVVENKGFELEVSSRNIIRGPLTWTTTAILTHNRNTLIDFAGASGLISTVDSKRPAEWIALEGFPVSTFYGYVVKEEIDPQWIKDPFYPINAQSQDIYVQDLNGDGVIDTDDRTVLGSPYPDFIWSITNTLRWRSFDFQFMFQGSQGAEVRNISSQYIKNEFSGNQDYTSDFPDKDLVQQRIFTNDDIQDASYIALRNINLGYTFGPKLLDKVKIQQLRVYLSAQNLLYQMAEGYEGWNPEGIDQGLGNPLTYGYQRGPAPIYRTFSGGINLGF
ncbi:MAG: TonB-dependent receptor [Bacteroidota bacterium]